VVCSCYVHVIPYSSYLKNHAIIVADRQAVAAGTATERQANRVSCVFLSHLSLQTVHAARQHAVAAIGRFVQPVPFGGLDMFSFIEGHVGSMYGLHAKERPHLYGHSRGLRQFPVCNIMSLLAASTRTTTWQRCCEFWNHLIQRGSLR
jgi:hypothetical protein